MKSLDKFQYDSSPHTNEEVEELDEISIVGMVRAGGQAVKNVLQKGKNLIKKAPDPTPTLSTAQRMSNALDKPEVKDAIKNKRGLPQNNKVNNVIKNQTKKVERVQKRAEKKIDTAKENRVKEFATTRNLLNLKKDPSSKGFQRAQRNITSKPTTGKDGLDNAGSNKPSLSTRIKRLGYKDPSKARDLVRGGINSKLVRNVGSVAKAVGQEITKTPDNKIAYNQKGDGYQGAFQGLGSNVKGVGKNVMKAPTFSSTTKDKKTGEIKPGEQVGTVGDKLGLTSLANRNIDKSSNLAKQQVTSGGNEPTQSLPKEDQPKSGGKSKSTTSGKSPTLNVSNQGRTINKVSVNTTTTKPKQKDTSQSQNPDFVRRRMMGASGEDSNTSSTEVTPPGKEPEKTDNLTYKSKGGQLQGGTTDKEGNPIDRFSRDKQAYVTYNTGRRMVDANPNLKDQLSDTQVPANPRTSDEGQFRRKGKRNTKKNNNEEFIPKLFEQFLFEIDTKSTKKKKKDGRGMHPHDEIKPMSGTNTITINPEDETSKYKRGY
tara:strand:- start:348 stop:1970 length:1623 start_codon:yes stop_codon:yes gene_type:complete